MWPYLSNDLKVTNCDSSVGFPLWLERFKCEDRVLSEERVINFASIGYSCQLQRPRIL